MGEFEMIKIIGLTGPSGAGKTTLCEIATRLGIKSIDADAVYHDLLIPPSECLCEIASVFGCNILDSDGTLNRASLASIVFDPGDKEKKMLGKLNKITHKYVLAKIREIIRESELNGEEMIIVDAPALYESGFDKECCAVICLIADISTRLDRIIKRDNISGARANERLRGQNSDEFYSSRADFVIANNGDTKQMENELSKIITKIKNS